MNKLTIEDLETAVAICHGTPPSIGMGKGYPYSGYSSVRLPPMPSPQARMGVPLSWFPRLLEASDDERRNWTLLGKGKGIHWPDLDEDISVAGLLGLPD